MATLVRRIENLEIAARTFNDSDKVLQMSQAERTARLAELAPRFWAEINQNGLSAEPERRQRQERIIELLKIAEQRRNAALAAQGVSE